MFACWAIHTAWLLGNAGHHRRFVRSLNCPDQTQRSLLQRIVAGNAATAFGGTYGFDRIDSVEAYQRRVPIQRYEELVPFVDRIRSGEPNVLTRQRVERLVPTSGSVTATKLIPYTAGLRRAFNAAIGPWITDLYRAVPELKTGPAYWSISPAVDFGDRWPSEVPVGFDSDSEYLGSWMSRLMNRVLVAPEEVRNIRSLDRFRQVTLLHLLRCEQLRLISVWHPSFLVLLLDAIAAEWPELLDALPPRRADYLRGVDRHEVSAIWPHLRVVSTWMDAHAALGGRQLTERLPGVTIQPKGLLATEGVVSIPYRRQHPLAVCSHFLELIDEFGRPRLAQELQIGGEYEVVLTTQGGLYRYAIGDRIRVESMLGSTPSIRFVGRGTAVVDQAGEKLNDALVAATLRELMQSSGLSASFAMLAPDIRPAGQGYTLFIETRDEIPSDLPGQLDVTLGRNVHYQYARRLGQLGRPRIFRITGGAEAAYLQRKRSSGARLGDIKPVALDGSTWWASVFAGDYCDEGE